jgi:hypothetical protein
MKRLLGLALILLVLSSLMAFGSVWLSREVPGKFALVHEFNAVEGEQIYLWDTQHDIRIPLPPGCGIPMSMSGYFGTDTTRVRLVIPGELKALLQC